ncbi:MAG: secretion system protein C, partial [Sphingobium sp. 32-64-5]
QRAALFRAFDPFYPVAPSAAGPQNVTSLALTLFGVRINEGSGLGSAILASSDGVQNSYAVGDEIMPGVLLKAVAFDHVVIDRNGAEESIFLDQSASVEPTSGGRPDEEDGDGSGRAASPGAAPEKPLPGRLTVDALKAGVGYGPRMSNGRITGIVLTQKGPGFAAAGFRSGDIITQINGRPIGSADDLSGLQQALTPGARVSLMVERGAQVVPIAILVQEQ